MDQEHKSKLDFSFVRVHFVEDSEEAGDEGEEEQEENAIEEDRLIRNAMILNSMANEFVLE